MAKNSNEIGRTGLSEFSGQIQADFLREMRGIQAYKNFNEMRNNSAIVGSLLLAIRTPVLAMEWTPASTVENDPRLEFLKAAIDGMSYSWSDHVAEALLFLPFGYYPFEICYRRGGGVDEYATTSLDGKTRRHVTRYTSDPPILNGKITWRKFSPRGQDTITRWKFSDDGGIEGYYQRVSWTEEKFIPIDKTILYRINVERNNPEGRSLLRTAWTSYYYGKHIGQAEAIGIERGMDGFPVITLPQGASTNTDDPSSDASVAAEFVRNIRNDEQAGMVVLDGWKFDLFAPGAQSRLDADKVIRRYEARILMSALAQFLNLGQEGIGSLALSKDQTDFFAMSLNATADVITDAVTKYAIPRLMKLNGYDAEGLSLTHTPATQEDTSKLGTTLQQLAPFINITAEDEVWIRQLLRMPERDVEDIEADMEEKQERKDAFSDMFNKNTDKADEKEDEKPEQKFSARFAASAPDEAIRTRWEKKFKKQLELALEKSKRRVIKAAREYRK